MHQNVRLFRLPLPARYALEGMLYLAKRPQGEPYCLLEEIAGSGRLPKNFLSKIFQNLTRAGLLESRRGRSGGYALARPADRITLMEIVQPIQEPFPEKSHCSLRSGSCSATEPCVLHDAVVRWEESLKQKLENTTLSQAAEREGSA